MKRKWELSRNWAQMEAKTGTNDTTAPDDDNEDENGEFHCFDNQIIEFKTIFF